MGFRFRKSKKIGPFRVNVSKSGIGWSVGTKGFRYTKRADGKTQKTYSIPGTGISYVDVKGKNKKSSNINNISSSSNNNFNNNKPKIPFYKRTLFLWFLLIFLPPAGIALMWGTKKYNKKPRIVLSALFAFYSLILYTPTPTDTNNNIAQNNTEIQSENVVDEAENQKLAEEQAAAEEAEKQRIAQEQAAAEEAERQRIAQEQAAAEEAERQRIAQEQAAAEEAERQRIAQEQAAAEEAERQRIAQEQAAAQANQNSQSSQTIGQTVYIAASGEGTKYHSRSSCSNMNGTIELSVDEAISRGYSACKKCH